MILCFVFQDEKNLNPEKDLFRSASMIRTPRMARQYTLNRGLLNDFANNIQTRTRADSNVSVSHYFSSQTSFDFFSWLQFEDIYRFPNLSF